MICPNCGFTNKDNTKNCRNCGYLLVPKKEVHINYLMLIGALIIAILAGELSYVFGGMYHTNLENNKEVIDDRIEVATAKENIFKDTSLTLDDITFIKISKVAYTNKMLDKNSFLANKCVNSNILKDSLIYKEQLNECEEPSEEELDTNLSLLILPNNYYGLKKNNYADIYVKTVSTEKLVFGKIYERALIREVTPEEITLVIPKEYNCLLKNAESLEDTELVLTNTHSELAKISSNYLKGLLESKTKDKGCELNEE